MLPAAPLGLGPDGDRADPMDPGAGCICVPRRARFPDKVAPSGNQ